VPQGFVAHAKQYKLQRPSQNRTIMSTLENEHVISHTGVTHVANEPLHGLEKCLRTPRGL